MWNPNQQEDEDSWEVRAFAEDTGNVMGTTWPPRSYTCTFCRREFRSAQALGGHMNVHRRDRARLHQPHNVSNNPYVSPSNSSSCSTLLIPAEDIVGNGGLCLYSLPNPNNNLFGPLKTFGDDNSSFLSISLQPTTNNLMNFPLDVAPHNIKSCVLNSSNIEASMSTNSHNNNIVLTNSVVEEIDLELRLGCSSSSPS